MANKNSTKQKKDKETGGPVQAVRAFEGPEKLIQLLIPGDKGRKRAVNQITTEGSKHSRRLTALLLQRLYQLVQNVEKTSGTPFVLQGGFILINGNEKDRFLFPLPVPILIEPAADYIKTAKAMLKLPEHEALTFTMLVQVIEWVIKATAQDKVVPLPVLIHKVSNPVNA